ncbi:uncharacterized protein DS421_17g577950 [Arachis hypogaea]|nr:uncharacterized protein DS421_17g577950 [Arachis hypogaea]
MPLEVACTIFELEVSLFSKTLRFRTNHILHNVVAVKLHQRLPSLPTPMSLCLRSTIFTIHRNLQVCHHELLSRRRV